MARTKQSVMDAQKARNAMKGTGTGINKRSVELRELEEKIAKTKAKHELLMAAYKKELEKEETQRCLADVRVQLDMVTSSDSFIKLTNFYNGCIAIDLTNAGTLLSTHDDMGCYCRDVVYENRYPYIVDTASSSSSSSSSSGDDVEDSTSSIY
jgi:hypothetical protein